jgi:DNA-binding winged helix-turn-helix (wHTH) protein
VNEIAASSSVTFGVWRFDWRPRRLFRRDDAGARGWLPIAASSRALDVLAVLLQHPGTVISRDEFMDAVWPGVAIEANNLAVHIASLRRLLDQKRTGESCIVTEPGRGYRFALKVNSYEEEASPPISIRSPLQTVDKKPKRARFIPWRQLGLISVLVSALMSIGAWHYSRFASLTHPPPPIDRRASVRGLHPWQSQRGPPC